MVLEAIISAAAARRHPVFILIQSIVFASVAIWLSSMVFPGSASILSIALITIGLMPIINSVLRKEEAEEEKHPGKSARFLGRHFDVIQIFGWFFIGLILAYSFWYVVLPESVPQECLAGKTGIECNIPTRGAVFAEQEQSLGIIKHIRAGTTGKMTAVQGYGSCYDPSTKNFWACTGFIFENNAAVLGLAIVFSLLYGAGAIFLIGWNASIIGTVIGQDILKIAAGAAAGPVGLGSAYFMGLANAVALVPHGSLEIVAYFIGAISGGIISAAILRKTYKKKIFGQILKDVFVLIAIAYLLLIAAAMVEAYFIVGG